MCCDVMSMLEMFEIVDGIQALERRLYPNEWARLDPRWQEWRWGSLLPRPGQGRSCLHWTDHEIRGKMKIVGFGPACLRIGTKVQIFWYPCCIYCEAWVYIPNTEYVEFLMICYTLSPALVVETWLFWRNLRFTPFINGFYLDGCSDRIRTISENFYYFLFFLIHSIEAPLFSYTPPHFSSIRPFSPLVINPWKIHDSLLDRGSYH